MDNEDCEFEQEDSFQAFLNKIGEKPSTTLRCFDRGAFFTLHGEDAELTAKDYCGSSAALKTFHKGGKSMRYVVVKKLNSDNFFKHFLLKRQYRVEVYVSKTKSGRDNDWSLAYKASPGNLGQFEDVLFSNVELSATLGVMSLNITQHSSEKLISVAFCDPDSRSLALAEFADSDHLTNLESVLLQLGARECLIPADSSSPELSQGRASLERAGLLVTEVKKADFNGKDIEEDVNRLLKDDKNKDNLAATLPEFELKGAMGCLHAIIKFLNLTADESNFHTFLLKQLSLDNYVKLDSGAIKALNLFPTSTDSNRFQSLYGLMNNCRTPQGQRLLGQWLKQPLLDTLKINERLDLVESLIEDSELRQILHEDHLRRVPDLQRLAKRLQRNKASLEDCFRIHQTVVKLRTLVSALENHSGKHAAVVRDIFTASLTECLALFDNYQNMLQSTLDFQMVQQHVFQVKPEFDETLTELREKLDEAEAGINQEFENSARKLTLDPNKNIKLDTAPQIGYFMRVTRKEEKGLRDFKSFDIIDTQKNGVRFRNAAMSSFNETFLGLRAEYEDHQKSIVAEILKIAGGYLDPIHQLNSLVALIDVITALAMLAVSAPGLYVRPSILPRGSGVLQLGAARHPCLEAQDDLYYIPNDTDFSREKSTFHIITGPNMGGKSTYIRAVAVITLMAQMGSFVPCESATISTVGSVMARVGATDSQIKGVSTFQAEMLETAAILRSANKDSLIIIDELGRGTSTYDGFGLAWSISEHISRELSAFCFFATHFHELTELANQIATVENFHVTATTSKDELVLLYKVKPGVCDRSFGIHVAELAHLPREVIDMASAKAQDYESIQWLTVPRPRTIDDTANFSEQNIKNGLQDLKDIVSEFVNLPLDAISEEELCKFQLSLKQRALSNEALGPMCRNLLSKKVALVK